ncbi:disulfide bond formation protein DsbA [Aminobacter sp. Y103A]|jgi:predicted DsbA family dithiol-disulfide isomerase|uniref:DsbA family oxidoreductase n=1 Tax=Aminobacter sp. Y103A TaxID=1870862 RepID=UPI002572E52E|nr:DsbA family protein [Aminobacter sp. SS-2016]BBD37868.1 disulfide bond formation protein DsbA [Aminobacter sp. SS-2016]
MSEQNRITIDVVSDVVCPWCFLGMKRLENALASLPDIKAEVHWRPFQLDPTIPPEGKERKAYMLAKFSDENRLKQVHANLVSLGAVEGISFDFDAITVAPNTLDAHRLIRWAAASGDGVQDKLARLLFSLYFEQGKNIGDHAVLVEAGREAGMDTAVVESLLATDADRDDVTNEIVTASRMGITGVPCFLLDGKYAVMGAQDSATLADAIRQVAAEKAAGEPTLN